MSYTTSYNELVRFILRRGGRMLESLEWYSSKRTCRFQLLSLSYLSLLSNYFCGFIFPFACKGCSQITDNLLADRRRHAAPTRNMEQSVAGPVFFKSFRNE
jgi:hypothetical protein